MINALGWLDQRTLVAVAMVFAVLLSVFGALIWWTRKTYPGFGRWTIANTAFSLSLLLFTLRPVTPDWIGVVGANVLLVVASIQCLEGTREFRGLAPHVWMVYLAASLALLAEVYFDYAVPSINARITAMSSFMGLVGILCAVTLLREMPAGRRFGLTFTGVMFAMAAAVQIIRAIYFHFAQPLSDLFAPSWLNAAFHLGATPAIIGVSIGWVLLTDERMVMDLRDAESRAARANRELAEAMAEANALARRATAADAAKSELLGIVSHEVRNPLSAVKAMTDLLLDTGLTAKQEEYAQIVSASADALLRVTDDLLDLYRIEAGRLTIESSAFDLGSVMEGVVKIFAPIAKGKGLNLVLEYPPGIPRRFLGDAGRIRQVILNLVGNAMKFTPTGQVRIAAAREGQDEEMARMRVSVSDSGIGISPDRIALLFEKLNPDQIPASPQPEGHGMGLTISKRLIELMGGCLSVESQVGKGSIFWFTLPLPPAT